MGGWESENGERLRACLLAQLDGEGSYNTAIAADLDPAPVETSSRLCSVSVRRSTAAESRKSDSGMRTGGVQVRGLRSSCVGFVVGKDVLL